MNHPSDIESILTLVKVDGNNKLEARLREYIAPLLGNTEAVEKAPVQNAVPFDVGFLDGRDPQRLDKLEAMSKEAGASKRRLQIFFTGSLRNWVDEQP